MRCQEGGGGGGGGEDDPPLVPRLGTRTGSTLLFSTTTRFCDMKQKRNYSFLTSRSIAKTSYTIRSSGVLLQTGRVFLMTFIVGVKSYMEVSNRLNILLVLPVRKREGSVFRCCNGPCTFRALHVPISQNHWNMTNLMQTSNYWTASLVIWNIRHRAYKYLNF